MRLTTSPSSSAECHEIWEPKPPGTLWATPGLTSEWYTDVDYARKSCTIFIKIILRFSSTLHSTRAAALLGVGIGSRTDLRSVRVTHRAKQVQYVERQEKKNGQEKSGT